jgi:hypothetical protein
MLDEALEALVMEASDFPYFHNDERRVWETMRKCAEAHLRAKEKTEKT